MSLEENILVESTVSAASSIPQVLISYRGKQITMLPGTARQRAIAIFSAAAYAEAEAAVFTSLVKTKGFGKPSQRDLQMAGMMLQLVRQQRQPLPEGVDAIFGFKTQQPIVVLSYPGLEKVQLDPSSSRHHATCLLEAVEASKFDAFWYKFSEDNLTLNKDETSMLIAEYKDYKEKFELESML